jgi:chromosome segregation ATPase
LLQHESEDLEEKVAALSRIKLQIVENSKQCVLHVETTLSAIQQTMQSSLREDIAASVMPKFESLISSVLADFESIAAAVSVLEKSDSREQPQSVIEAALLAKAEHYQTQIRNAEQRLADVDLKRQEIISQLEEKVSQSGQVVASNRAEAGALQEKAQHLRSQVDQLNEKLALLGTQVVSEKEALLQQEQLRAGLHMECEESYSKLQAERRLCAQLEHTAADLQSQKAAIEQDIAVARARL